MDVPKTRLDARTIPLSGCAFRCSVCGPYPYRPSHACPDPATSTVTIDGVTLPACAAHNDWGHVEPEKYLNAAALLQFARARQDRVQVREVSRLLGVLHCANDECLAPIMFDPRTQTWWHVEGPDFPHAATPACTCEHGDTPPDPLCREHGVDDVVCGAYDRSAKIRKHVDQQLASVNR